jgi:hypothetical protein
VDPLAHFGLLPFTRREALDAGVTKREWERAVADLHKIRRGVYLRELAAGDCLRHAQLTAAAMKGRTNHLACSGSAAALLGLPNPFFTWWSRVPVTVAGPKSTGEVRRALAAWDPVATVWGLSTGLIDTAVTLAAELPLPAALMVTDAVARRLAGTKDRFELASHECRSEVRRRLTESSDLPALRLANPAAESPAESFYRGHMLEQGFVEPACGVPLLGASGRQYFADMVAAGVLIEVDGKEKYEDLDVLIAEKRREDDLRMLHPAFLRSWVEDLYADPAGEMRRLGLTYPQVFPDLGMNYSSVISTSSTPRSPARSARSHPPGSRTPDR